jgi:hypothetical protein
MEGNDIRLASLLALFFVYSSPFQAMEHDPVVIKVAQGVKAGGFGFPAISIAGIVICKV